MATTDRLTPWNTKHNFCALRSGYDYYPNGQHRDLELAQVMSATSIANSIIRQLLGGTLGHGKVFRDRETGKVTRMPTGIDKIRKTEGFLGHPSTAPGMPAFGQIIPKNIDEAYLACPMCNHMNHFLRSRDSDSRFECKQCHFK